MLSKLQGYPKMIKMSLLIKVFWNRDLWCVDIVTLSWKKYLAGSIFKVKWK